MEKIDAEQKTSRNSFRLLVGAAAVVVTVAAATAVIAAGDDTGGNRTDGTSATQPIDTTATTDSPDTTVAPTTTPPSTATSAIPPDSTAPGGTDNGAVEPSVRDVDFANRTYPAPFPSLDPGTDVTLHDGGASLNTERAFVVGLEPVVYGDLDGDGVDDALVVLFCHHQMAEEAAAWAAVYRVGADGQPEIVGTPLPITDNITELQAPSGRQVTAIVYVDPVNLGALRQRTWEFDGSTFHVVADDPYPG